MSGDARQAVEDLEDHKQTSLHHGNPDAEIHSENEDVPMSQLGQPTELRNGNELRRCTIPPYAAGSTKSNSTSDEEWDEQYWQERYETEWIDRIQRYLHSPDLRNRQTSDVSIFRVPKFLKDTKKEAYEAQKVSLGPYNYRSEELPPMNHHKVRALCRMMKRFSCNNNLQVDPNGMDFAKRARREIRKLEKEIRDMYEDIPEDGEDLALMLCLDGCFLREVLRTLDGFNELSGDKLGECYDPIFKIAYSAKDVLNDILKLENQIPFIVLQKLLQLEVNSASAVRDRSLLNLLMEVILYCFSPFHNEMFDIEQWSWHHPPRHLLDFLHTGIASPTFNEGECLHECSIDIDLICRRKRKKRNDTYVIPRAVELRNAGIKFSALQGGSINLIHFDKKSATIFLPPISIMDRTEVVFRNLIAYEMCMPFEINYVSSYAALMKDLINTEQDVALLRRMDVLKNWLGSDKEVVDLFNGLCEKVTVIRKDVFHNLTEKVIEHYDNNEMKIQIGILVQDHFSSPWKALALMAAILILLLTVLQTIFTIISTYKK